MVAGSFAPNPAVFRRHAAVFGKRLGAFVVHADQHVAQGQFEPFDQRIQVPMHAGRVALQHQHRSVQVRNQPRHAVALRMDQATSVLVLFPEQAQVLAHPDRICDLLVPPLVVRECIFKGQHANGDARIRGIVSPSQARALVGKHLHPIPSLRLPFNAFDATAEHPRVSPTDALVALRLQGHARAGWGSLVHGPKLGVLSAG